MNHESIVLFPLRSNAHSLVAGSGVGSVERRLKVACLYADRVLLETGTFDVSAGPGGSFANWHPADEATRWQSARRRGDEMKGGFQISIGEETTPGVRAEAMEQCISSSAEVSWDATFEPFRRRLPKGLDAIDWVRTANPDGELRQLMLRWARQDRRNPALGRSLTSTFVRQVVVDSANRDLAVGAGAGVAVSLDGLHSSALSTRFADPAGWRMQGFALPVLVPDISRLPWEAVANIRRDRRMRYFREVLVDLEQNLASEALAGGDLDRAVHLAHEAKVLERANLASLAGAARSATWEYVVGGGTGLLAMGIHGPASAAAGAAAGTAISFVPKAVRIGRTRPTRAWAGVIQRLRDEAAAAAR